MSGLQNPLHNIQPIDLLSSAYRRRETCVVTGAGVSAGCGLPQWKELQSLVLGTYMRSRYAHAVQPTGPEWVWSTVLQQLLGGLSPLVCGRFLRAGLGTE